MMGEPKESFLALVSHGMASRPSVWGELVNLWLTGQTCIENGALVLSAWSPVHPRVPHRNPKVRVYSMIPFDSIIRCFW